MVIESSRNRSAPVTGCVHQRLTSTRVSITPTMFENAALKIAAQCPARYEVLTNDVEKSRA